VADKEISELQAEISELQYSKASGIYPPDHFNSELRSTLEKIIPRRIVQLHNLQFSTYLTPKVKAARIRHQEDQIRGNRVLQQGLVKTPPPPRDEPKHWLSN
jgi:hypothetical protein